MALLNFNCRRYCTLFALIVAVLLGIVAAFLQITGTITVAVAFLWVALGIAVVHLAVLLVTSALVRRTERKACLCGSLAGVLPTSTTKKEAPCGASKFLFRVTIHIQITTY